MAAQNRDELQTQIDSTFVATLQIADHRNYLKDPQAESLVFRKDVIASQIPAGGSVEIDFSNKDLAKVTTTGNLAVSFTGMENGDVKYLRIQKNAGNTVSFTGATDVSPRRTYINTTVTVVYYRVKNKNNSIFVCAESVDFDWQPDIDAIQNQLDIIHYKINIGDWDMDTDSQKTIDISSLGIDNSKIEAVDAYILPDISSTVPQPLKGDSNSGSGGLESWLKTGSTSITLNRVDGGRFDNTGYDQTSYNRGWIIIHYDNT